MKLNQLLIGQNVDVRELKKNSNSFNLLLKSKK